jgi:hypothetical protein
MKRVYWEGWKALESNGEEESKEALERWRRSSSQGRMYVTQTNLV